MKNFCLGVLDENGEVKECSEEFFKPVEGNLYMPDIELHHPPTYFGVDLAVELDAPSVHVLRKALRAPKKEPTQTVTVYKDYIDTRVYIRRDLFTNRRICAAAAKSFVDTLRLAISNAALEATNTPVLSITLVHKRFGRKKKKRIKKQLGGLPLRPIIAKLFMEQLWLEVENCSRAEAWKAFWEALKTYVKVEEEADGTCKAYKEVLATEYKAWEKADWRAFDEAWEAVEATPEYKEYWKA